MLHENPMRMMYCKYLYEYYLLEKFIRYIRCGIKCGRISYQSGSTCSLSWEVLGFENLLGQQTSLSPPTPSITTPSPPSLPYLTHHRLHLTLFSRDFITKCNRRNKLSFSLPVSFTSFKFPIASCWISLLQLQWLLCCF